MSPPHDFRDCLARSHAAADLPVWEEMYRQAFPDFLVRIDRREYGPHQRQGIDCIVKLGNGREIPIDEKVRGRGKHGVIYNDVALEYISVDRTGAPGWVENPAIIAEYIAYAIAPLGSGYLLPVLQLQQAWKKNKQKWLLVYGPHAAPNNGYLTYFCPVPVPELFAAIGSQLRLKFTPFEMVGGVPVLSPPLPTPAPVAEGGCPHCHQPLAPKDICWACQDRLCERCGRLTGSDLISVCWLCEVKEP
jgi:hypothetical protein